MAEKELDAYIEEKSSARILFMSNQDLTTRKVAEELDIPPSKIAKWASAESWPEKRKQAFLEKQDMAIAAASDYGITLSKLEPQKFEMLVLLVQGKNQSEIAKELSIDRATVWRWKQEKDFAEALNVVRTMECERLVDKKVAYHLEALDGIMELARDKKQPPSFRGKMYETILKSKAIEQTGGPQNKGNVVNVGVGVPGTTNKDDQILLDTIKYVNQLTHEERAALATENIKDVEADVINESSG